MALLHPLRRTGVGGCGVTAPAVAATALLRYRATTLGSVVVWLWGGVLAFIAVPWLQWWYSTTPYKSEEVARLAGTNEGTLEEM